MGCCYSTRLCIQNSIITFLIKHNISFCLQLQLHSWKKHCAILIYLILKCLNKLMIKQYFIEKRWFIFLFKMFIYGSAYWYNSNFKRLAICYEIDSRQEIIICTTAYGRTCSTFGRLFKKINKISQKIVLITIFLKLISHDKGQEYQIGLGND